MSAPLTPEEESEFTRIIDAILATADLQTVTRKKIRQGLEAALGKELTEQKHAVRNLIEARFDAINSVESQAMPTPPLVPTTEASPRRQSNGASVTPSEDTDANNFAVDDVEEDADSLPPANKRHKRDSSIEEADAKLAAELQAQENRLARARTTRGGASSKPSKPRSKTKTAKKKGEKRARDDDSDVDSDSAPKRKSGGGFQKPFNLSYPLAEICGMIQMSRPQVVKKLWEHIKANDLQDPKDKRQIRCDEKMQAVFKTTKVDMFQMNKLLGHQLYPIEEE